MRHQNFFPLLAVVLLLMTTLAACGQIITNAATETATLPLGTATKTSRPTSTPRPTVTPDIVKTQNYDDIFLDVQKFKDQGLIASTSGKYSVLEDYDETFAQRGWLNYWYYGFQVEQFVYKAHIRWSTAGETNETSGCGIVFAVQPRGDGHDYYGVVLDRTRIYFSVTKSGYYYDLGKSRGTGKLNFGNPAEADLTLVVYDYKANVFVDDEFIGEYTLSKDRELKGKFGYGIISGTNRDYGTSCQISNSRMWKLDE